MGAQTPGEPEHLWQVQDVSGYLGVPVSSIYKMTAPKARLRIPHIRINGLLRFRRADIDEWLELLKVSRNDVLKKVTAKAHGKHPKAEVA